MWDGRGGDGIVEIGGGAKDVVFDGEGEGSLRCKHVICEGETEVPISGCADGAASYVFVEIVSVRVRGVAFTVGVGDRGGGCSGV